MVFTVLTLPPLPVLLRVSIAVNIAALVATIWMTFGGLGYRAGAARPGLSLLVAAAVFWTEPVQRTLYLGQIELLLTGSRPARVARPARIGRPDPRRWSAPLGLALRPERGSSPFPEGTMTVTADDLDAAISSVVSTLRPAADRDWSARAGTLEWDCWHTAEHIGDCLLSYAAQLVAQPTTRYVRFMAGAEQDASPDEVLEFAETGARILAATLRTASPDVRAYHPTGMADPEGFAGMGCVEALLHGSDIADGLGLSLDPPPDVCGNVLVRMFPQAAADLAGTDPWAALQWATGRSELPGHPRLQQWRWRAAPG
jgi:Glycosyltransferase family 87